MTTSNERAARPQAAEGDPQTPGATAPSVSEVQPPTCPTRTRTYRGGAVIAEGFPAESISEVLAADERHIVWLDLFDPDEADLRIVTEEFGLHPLAVEDAIHDHQRPKIDRYQTHLFLNVYAVELDNTPRLVASEISVFVTQRALVTVRKSDFEIDSVIARWDLDPDLARDGGIGYLLHGLLDAIVDGHYAALETLEDDAADLEDHLFAPRSDFDIRRRGFQLRRAVADLRRVVAPMHDVISRLLRNNQHLVVDALAPYYEDVLDHAQRTAESVDSARDQVTSILDANMTEQSNELNEITKKLASWAAIIAVPTAVTGFYGQNVPYPGFGSHAGFWSALIVMIVLAGGVYTLLRKQGWL